MPTLRQSTLALALVIAAGCAKCGGAPKTVTPTERFVSPSAAVVLVVPKLSAFAQQSADVLATAATFPGGQQLSDARAVIGNRLTLDPFDAASIGGAGLDPARGLALFGVIGKGGEQSPDVVFTLPVADPVKLEAAIAKIAKERLEATDRAVEAGAPEVIVWRTAAGGPILFAYALSEQTAIFSFGPAAVETVRGAAAVPATATLASVPEYQKATKALGDGHALRIFVPANSPALKELPQLKGGLSLGILGGRDRIGLSAAVPMGDREAAIREGVAKGQGKALLAKLEPSAAWVARGEGEPSQSTDVQAVFDNLAKQGVPDPAIELVKDFIGAMGSGSAMGLAVLPPAAGSTARLDQAPLAALRAEILVALKDPEKMTATIQRAIDMATEQAPAQAPKGKKGKPVKPSFGKNPWRIPLPGGEVAAAVADGRFALVAGPAGALEALLGRSGSAFKGPTAAADKALQSSTGGMFVDVPRLAAAARAYPESAFGEGGQGAMVKSMVDLWSTAAARITAVSVGGDLSEGMARGDLLVEVTPTAPAAPAAPAPVAK